MMRMHVRDLPDNPDYYITGHTFPVKSSSICLHENKNQNKNNLNTLGLLRCKTLWYYRLHSIVLPVMRVGIPAHIIHVYANVPGIVILVKRTSPGIPHAWVVTFVFIFNRL